VASQAAPGRKDWPKLWPDPGDGKQTPTVTGCGCAAGSPDRGSKRSREEPKEDAMKRVVVLAFAAVLALGMWAWSDTDIYIHAMGEGDHQITEILMTPAGYLVEDIFVSGFMVLDKWVGVDIFGNFQEYKYFYGDGYVEFFEFLEVETPWYGIQEIIDISGYGWVELEKFADVYYDPFTLPEGMHVIELDAFIVGEFYDGYVGIGEGAWAEWDWDIFWPWWVEQDFDYLLMTPSLIESVTHIGTVYEEEAYFQWVDAYFFMEPFTIDLYVYDYAW
jgi:hypothetical protein